MKLDEIRSKIEDYVGQKVKINYNLGRNKHEHYEAKIKKIYNNVFLVEINSTTQIKSFSYTDVITKTIKIDFLQKKEIIDKKC